MNQNNIKHKATLTQKLLTFVHQKAVPVSYISVTYKCLLQQKYAFRINDLGG